MIRPYVTVVSGVPRSGTSLVMQMLAAGGLPLLFDDARPPDEDNPRGYYELAAVKSTGEDASWLDRAEGHAVKVVHALVPELPPDRAYRLVLVRRSWAEVLASQQAMLARADAGGQDRGGDAPRAFAEESDRLVRGFEAGLRAAEAWARAAPRCRLLRLGHRRLLEDPRAEAERLAAFLDGGLDVAAMAAAVDPDLYRQRHGPPLS